MGCDTGQDNEKPVHRVWIDEFLLGARQVTNAEYGRFLRDRRAALPAAAVLERPRVQPSRAARRRSIVVRGNSLLRMAQHKHRRSHDRRRNDRRSNDRWSNCRQKFSLAY